MHYENIPHPRKGELEEDEGNHHHEKELPKGKKFTFALAGNQNCGKTTLFNQLTGANQHVGNFPGVTVDRKDGTIRNHPEATVTDLPGIYSLSPYSSEEIVTRDFLLKSHPDGIINIVDASNLERNLCLTMQLMELGIPMVLALSMMDEVRENGGSVRENELEKILGIPVVPISAAKNEGVDAVTGLISKALAAADVNTVVQSLVVDGVCKGVGSVISFLPTIVTLFFFLSILEDTGYMARVAFVMDKPLRKIGLSGRSFVPMLIGFGCSVPAIMSTRTLSSERDRKLTILLTPFMSCSAKLPIYSLMVSTFFVRKYQALVMVGLYVFGIICGILYSLILNKTKFKGEPVPFVMELPNYRLPSAKSVVQLLWEKAKGFLQKAFTIIFAATIVIWFLQTFDARFNVAKSAENSLLAAIGNLAAPLFAPLGFGDWRVATALITGFTAKESVVSTLNILLGGSTAGVSAMFTPFSAVVFLVFTLLYTPCVAAIATVKREMGGAKAATLIAVSQCAIAWVVAFVVTCSVWLWALHKNRRRLIEYSNDCYSHNHYCFVCVRDSVYHQIKKREQKLLFG